MIKKSSVNSLWQTFSNWGLLALLSTLFLGACGGGYDGGKSFEEPAPSPEPQVVEIPAPEPEPTPEPITRSSSPRKADNLDRGLVVFPADKGNAISWRLLGTDSPALGFEVYKNGSKLNEATLTHATFYKDEDGQEDDVYEIRAVLDGTEVSTSASVSPWAQAYLSIPLSQPMFDVVKDYGEGFERYEANDASAADLDGDGQYEIILKWMPNNGKDNAQAGKTAEVLIDAYTLEGTLLWRINLGRNIRAGAHYNPFMVYDFDGDGRAELAVKTADGTIDGRGNIIGDEDADYRNNDGYVLEGPEYLTMFDGLSGEALDTIDYVPLRGVVDDWGDGYGNRVDRFLAGVGKLGGDNHSLIMARGVYTRVVVAAFDWVDGAFAERWVFDTDNGGDDAALYGQGNHSLSVGDVDNDGFDEVIYGAGAIDNDGSILFSTGLCDGDALHMGDFNPERAGLEVFTVHEAPSCYSNSDEGWDHGIEMHDPVTGEILWSLSGEGADVGRGLTADIDPRYVGNESWASRGGLTAADGTTVGSGVKPGPTNFAIWWDGDLLRELLDGTTIYKWNYLGEEEYSLLNAASYGAVSNNGTKSTPSLTADLFGDWREEVIWADTTSSQLMIFSSPHDTNNRMHSLMHDTQYRNAVAWQNAGYNQPPHPSFYIGPDMDLKWESDIAQTESGEWAKLVAQGDDEIVEVRAHINGFEVSSIEIFRDTDADPEGRVSIATLAAGVYIYVDENVVPDVSYYYSAEISGSTASTSIEFSPSQTALSTTLLPGYRMDKTTQSGEGEDVGYGPARLTWATRNMDISAINIYRAETPDAETAPNVAGRTLVGTPAVTATEWIDDSSVRDISYFYWLEIVDDTAEVTYTPEPVFGVHIPIPLRTFTVEYANNVVEINWELADFRPSIASVEVYRNTAYTHSGRTRILRSAPTAGTFIDNNPPVSASDPGPAVAGVTYWYTLKVVLEDGARPNIPLLPEAGITIPVGEGLPLVGAWAEVVSEDPLEMLVSWQDYNIDIASIEVFRDTNTDGSTRVAVGNPDASATSWSDTTPTPGLTYNYWVEITDTEGAVHASPASNSVSLPPKTNLATVLNGSNIEVSWNFENFPVEITSVELYRNDRGDSLSGRDRIGVSLPTTANFVDDGSVVPLVSGTTYWYMFKLNGGDINTDPEAEISYP